MSPDDAHVCNELGGRMLALGRPQEAVCLFKKALAIDPGCAEAWFNLGLACRLQGDAAGAARCLRKALGLREDFHQALFVIGNIHLDAGEPEKAADCYRSVLAMAPGFADAHYNLGNACKAMGNPDEAAHCYARALDARPDFPQALNNLGVILKDAGRLEAALECYRRAIELKPELKEAHYNMGIARQLDGEFDEGLAHYRRALELDPRYAHARWLHDLSLPILYMEPGEIPAQRRRFAENLERLVRETGLARDDEIRRALEGVASTTHFFLQYQGQDDLALQNMYGRFVQRVMAANFPGWSRPREMPALLPGERIRLGYVSSFMRAHTVGSFLLGWLEAHDRGRFEIFGYHIGDVTDAVTERLKRHTDRFRQVGAQLEKAAGAIAADDLHILVYTDIGMNALATQLAALRLAPVQCKGWGHPVTTGLPTIDYYLTSDLMEPEGAERHYSETLVRLPNLALNYTPPALPRRPKTRRELGLREDAVVYLSSQSLFKYLPQHDDIYPRIARRVPNAQFVFIAHTQTGVTLRFARRLSKAFEGFGLRFEDSCRIQPRLGFEDFLSLNLASDALLDTLEWSGGKTTLEALACGVPVITLPGAFMRGRHAAAMLARMGAGETIAADKEDYIRLAAEIGRNPRFAGEVRARVAERRVRLYSDTAFMSALEAFFIRVAGASPAGKAGRARPGHNDLETPRLACHGIP